jgi:hypothetical protein
MVELTVNAAASVANALLNPTTYHSSTLCQQDQGLARRTADLPGCHGDQGVLGPRRSAFLRKIALSPKPGFNKTKKSQMLLIIDQLFCGGWGECSSQEGGTFATSLNASIFFDPLVREGLKEMFYD